MHLASLPSGTEARHINKVSKPEGQGLQATGMQIFIPGGGGVGGKEHTESPHKRVPSCGLAAAVGHDACHDHLRLPQVVEVALQAGVVECVVGVLWDEFVGLYSKKQRAASEAFRAPSGNYIHTTPRVGVSLKTLFPKPLI